MADNPQPPPDVPSPWRPSSSHGPRRGLGRGLGALIPGAQSGEDPSVTEIPVDRIRPGAKQPRVAFSEEALGELAASIREHGVLQPVLVRPVPGASGTYELVAGERRWRAAAAAGLRMVPAVIRSIDDMGALEAALVENLQREDLNAIERARAYRALIDEFGLTQEAVARRVGRSQPSIANTLRLLSLPPQIQSSLEAGRITEGHGRALLGITDQARMLKVWRQVEAKGLSVRAVERLARDRSISRENRARASGEAQDLNIIKQNLESVLGAPVRVVVRRRGGEIRILFHSHDDMDRIIERLSALRGGS